MYVFGMVVPHLGGSLGERGKTVKGAGEVWDDRRRWWMRAVTWAVILVRYERRKMGCARPWKAFEIRSGRVCTASLWGDLRTDTVIILVHLDV